MNLSAYGHVGPWSGRRGFDSLVQMASGIADESARDADADQPVPLPAQALDHATGWLAALGVVTALRRRAAVGGSWQVQLALARTGSYLDQLGRVEDPPPTSSDPTITDVVDLLAEMPSPFGQVSHVRVPGELVDAPPAYPHGPRVPGGDPPAWW